MSDVILNAEKLYKSYNDGTSKVEVLRGIDLSIDQGERLAIIGPSGSGKSTLLHLLGGLDKPTSGDVCIKDVNWQKINEKQRCKLRNQGLGFIYQFHHLLPEFTALENVCMPLLLANISVKDAEAEASKMLDDVGLKERKNYINLHSFQAESDNGLP